jgi:hypothetical protein
MKKNIEKLLLVSLFAFSANAFGEEAVGPLRVKWGAFIDTNYAYGFNRPGTDRILLSLPGGSSPAYSTQPARQNEFNINLAFVEAKVEGESIRGRLALQAGTSVQANYAGESQADASLYGGSGGMSRYLQEAVVGYEISPQFWVDAGVYFSHIGFESWISRDNWTYTRSLAAENSPYYQSGVRFSYQFSDQWSAQLHLLNGWQNINETNEQKALGTQVSWTPGPKWNLTHNSFLGNENGTRFFQNLILKYVWSDRVQIAANLDYGIQDVGATGEIKNWGGANLSAKYQLTSKVAFSGRVEKYADPHSIIVAAAPVGFNTWGGSIGVDSLLHPQVLWRNEVRGFFANDEVYSSSIGPKKNDVFVVTSLALTI